MNLINIILGSEIHPKRRSNDKKPQMYVGSGDLLLFPLKMKMDMGFSLLDII